MRARVMFLALAAMSVVAACEDDDDDDDVTYSATLLGAKERPSAITTSGTGTFTGTLDSETNVLTYNVTWSSLTSASTLAHIHGPIEANSGTAPLGVLIDFNNPTAGRTITHGVSGSATGTIDFKVALNANISGDSLKKLFDNGKVYVNVHTGTNPGGEILGNITRQP